MSDHRFHDEDDALYLQARDIILDACSKLGHLDNLNGMTTVAVISYLTVDEHGEEWTGRFYVGGFNNAIGLASRTLNALLARDLEPEE